MKYKSRTGKTISDQSFLGSAGDGASQFLKQDRSFLGNFLLSVFKFFIGMSAFISRSFLRSKLGERTFGIITVVSVYWIIWFLNLYVETFTVVLESMGKDFGKSVFLIIPAGIANLFYAPLSFLLQVGDQGYTFPTLNVGLNLLAIISTVLALAHLIEVRLRRSKNEVIHSYYRGDSLLFGRLEGVSIYGKTITSLHIWMIIEPLFVFAIGIILWCFDDFYQLGGVLILSAICLFVEEYGVYKENQRFILDMLDGRLDAIFAGEIQEQYEEGIGIAQKSSPKEYKATFGQNKSKIEEQRGSASPFRARIV
jgi:hypothetical protein